MSVEAVERVKQAITKLKLKGCKRALLEAIAERIPEGKTMTALLAIEDVAPSIGYYASSTREARDKLVELRLVRIVGGGQGRPAQYELLDLPGAGVDEGTLPLIGEAKPPRVAPPHHADTPLFDQVAVITIDSDDGIRADHIAGNRRSWREYFAGFRRCVVTTYFAGFRRCCRLYIAGFRRSTRPVVDVDDARARGSTDLREEEVLVLPAAASRVDEFLAWFEATYPTHHGGARCTIDGAKDGPRVQALLASGRSLARLKAMTLAMWTLTSDGVPKSERWYIAEVVQVRNIWLLHKKANVFDLEVTRAQPAAEAAGDLWTRVLRRLEATTNRHTYHSWFRETVLIADRGAVIEVAKPGEGSDVFAAWIPKHYGEIVRDAANAERPGTRVEFIVVDASRSKYG